MASLLKSIWDKHAYNGYPWAEANQRTVISRLNKQLTIDKQTAGQATSIQATNSK